MTIKPLSEKTFTEQFTTLTIKDQLLSLPKEIWLHVASFLNKSEIKKLSALKKGVKRGASRGKESPKSTNTSKIKERIFVTKKLKKSLISISTFV